MMSTKKKAVINPTRHAKDGAGKIKSVEIKLSPAQMEAQIAALEKQIALLKAGAGNREPEAESSLSPVPLSPGLRANLPAPVLGNVVANGPNSITIHWNSVENAVAYIVSVADNSAFDEANLYSAGPGATSWTVNGLQADTTYYVRVRANGSGDYGNSAYSASKSVATTGGSEEIPDGGNGGGSGGTDVDITGDLQNWLDALRQVDEQMFSSLHQFGNIRLSIFERRRLLGSGVRRYGYIDKVSDTAEEFPQFWPAYANHSERIKVLIREIEVLRNLVVFFESGARTVLDMLLIAGNEAFLMANVYYRSVRNAAQEQIPNAETVAGKLKSYWKRKRRVKDEPTMQEVERDASGLIHGTKEGNLSIINESDKIIKGKKAIVDNVVPKPRRKVKIVEEEVKE